MSTTGIPFQLDANNPIANMVEGMVKEAIREVVRDEIAIALVPVLDLVDRLNTLFDAGKDSKNLLLKALFKNGD